MANFIFMLTVVGSCITLGHLGVTFTDWEFWVVMGCTLIANLCGAIRSLSK